ncbi:MAG: flagellar hook-length control protein FliK, partial [Chloroflexi bacterium]|nr:flagellar hook-length control protein FliK [Chloroflexota bacterium]
SLIPSSSITTTTSPLVTDNQETEGDAVGMVAPQIQVAATGSGSATVSPIGQERENLDQPAPFPPGSNTIPDGGSAGREPTAPKITPLPLSRQTPGAMLEATISNTSGNLAGQIEQWLARQEVTAAPAALTLEPEPLLKPSNIRSQRATSTPGSQPPVMQLLLRGEMQAPPDARTVAIPQHLHQSPKVAETSYLPSGHQGGPSGRQSVGDAFIDSLSPGNLLLAPHEASPGRGHTAPSVTSAHGPVPTWQPQLVNEIASRIRLLGGAQKSGIEVNLEVTQLGRIGLSAIEQDNELRLKLFTDSSHIQNTIEAHLPQIKAALAEQGIRVGHFTVQSSQDTAGSFIAGNPQHGQGQQPEQQPRHIFIGWEDRAPAEEALIQSGSAEPARANIIDYRV